MNAGKKTWIALLGAICLAGVLACAPRGTADDPEMGEAMKEGESLVGGDAPRARRAPAALDRLNEDKTTANDFLASGRYQNAVDVLSPWAAQKVADPQVYSMLAKAQWKLDRHEDAIRNYEESLRMDYAAAYTHLELAELLLEIGKSGRAFTEFELAVQYGKSDPLPHYNYGLALHDIGRVDEAVAQWEIAYSYDPSDPRYAEALGIGLSGREPEKALEYFERAKAGGADHPGFHNNLGLLLERLGDMARAKSELENAVSGEPGNAIYRRNLALLYMKSNQPALAEPIWEGLWQEQPDDRLCRIYLGRAYLELGRFGEAVRILEEWVDTTSTTVQEKPHVSGDATGAPGMDEAYAVLAMSFRGLKRLDRAEVYMRKALDLSPDNVAHLINYGVVLAEDGKIAEAKVQWETALRLDPENSAAKRNLSAYHE